MRCIIFFLFLFVLPCVLVDADLCRPDEVTYTIGRNQTLLDVDSETISTLREPCYKQVSVAGSVDLRLFITELSLGYNKYYDYSGMGISHKRSFDKVFFSQNSCPRSQKSDNLRWTELRTGEEKNVNSSVFCFKFVPSKVGLNLGGHVRGKRVKILLLVNVATCHLSSQITSDDRPCTQLCNASGMITTCQDTAYRPSQKFTTTMYISSQGPASTALSTAAMAASAVVTQDVSHSHNIVSEHFAVHVQSSTLNPFKTTKELEQHSGPAKSATIHPYSNTGTENGKITTLSARNNIEINVLSLASTTAKETTKEPFSFASLNPLNIKSTSVPRTLLRGRTITTSSNSNGGVTWRARTTYSVIQASHSKSAVITSIQPETTTKTGSTSNGDAAKKEKLFGLVDGLYILVGCILTVLIILLVSCCIFRFRKYQVQQHNDQDSHTVSSSQVKPPSENLDMPWRDNWLVRHHSIRYHDPIKSDDTFNQSETDLQMIHGNFVHQSNPELHLIHNCRKTLDGSLDSIYDNAHYLLKLNKDDLDAKVKDVLRKQRMISITSYDLKRPTQRRRAHTVSESSMDSIVFSDNVSQNTNGGSFSEKDQRYRRKCQRSSSTVSSSMLTNERGARLAARRRRTLSQRSQAGINEEDNKSLSKSADLNNVSFRTQEGSSSQVDVNTTEIEQQNKLKSGSTKNSLMDTHSNQATAQEEYETVEFPNTVPKTAEKADKAWTVDTEYALVSQPRGTSGTMQFKK